ncbi:MAG: NADH-quinone oxidoreductase subunit N, partial [Chitinophagaceae bacterium]
MNAIIISAIWGVVMMFSGVLFKSNILIRNIATAGVLILLAGIIMDMSGNPLFDINTRNMLVFDNFGLFFNAIAVGCTLVYFLLSAPDMEKVGNNLPDYFALIFFILCGVSIASSFNNLLMLFLGIEIISIPLYILTGADKRNLKSNEASLKYFLMGAFST